ncbi:MAG TPA: amidohydrolase family protein [Candidatus Hydrogenedentes bacterium]|nr:amidohydrolase family protein [Candidatus Hydrogenedentota bacterium]
MSLSRRLFLATSTVGTFGLAHAGKEAVVESDPKNEDGNWTFNKTDAEIAASVQERLPDRLFDIHAHLYRKCDLGAPCPEFLRPGPDIADVDTWRTHLGKVCGSKRLAGALFVPYPVKKGDVDAGNDFVVEQTSRIEMSRGLIVVMPDSDRAKTEVYFNNPKIVGFKPYHVFAHCAQTFDAALEEYLPEWVWEMAAAHRAVILLHLVRHAALSDPGNQTTIRKYCSKYPKAILLLAHAGRGFHAPNTIRALPALKDLDNLYFDSAAVCEPDALMAIVKAFGPRRLLWGSDFPVSQQRGKCVTVGDAFSWICPRRIDIDPAAPVCHPTLVGLESLRAMYLVAELMELSKKDLEDIFFNNARRLLRLRVV